MAAIFSRLGSWDHCVKEDFVADEYPGNDPDSDSDSDSDPEESKSQI